MTDHCHKEEWSLIINSPHLQQTVQSTSFPSGIFLNVAPEPSVNVEMLDVEERTLIPDVSPTREPTTEQWKIRWKIFISMAC
jgi:hypothetical protein